MSSETHKSYFIPTYEIFNVFVRNVFQDNAIVFVLENHRIQLDNVGVVQFVCLRLTYQLIMKSATNKRTTCISKGLMHVAAWYRGPWTKVHQIWE